MSGQGYGGQELARPGLDQITQAQGIEGAWGSRWLPQAYLQQEPKKLGKE
jgi:hypothetical protein